jgi:hypothetical protein
MLTKTTLMKKLVLLLALFLSGITQAQTLNYQWGHALGAATGDDIGNAVAVDVYGSVINMGTFSSLTDFDPGPGTFTIAAPAYVAVYITKSDANGNLLWAKSIGTSHGVFGYALTLDVAGNIYLGGTFQGPTDFDPGAGTYSLTTNGNTDAFIVKLDTYGDFVWAATFGGTQQEYLSSLSVDAQNNVYASGAFSTSVDFDPGAASYSLTSAGSYDGFILKLNNIGNFVWAKQISGAAYNDVTAITTSAGGEVFAALTYSGTVDLDPGAASNPATAAGVYDMALIKLDAAGNFSWAKLFGGSGDDEPLAMLRNASGDLFITGFFSNTVDFDPGPGATTLTAPSNDLFILKLDMNGNFNWVKTFASTPYNIGAYNLAQDAAGNIYTAGRFNGSVDFDPGAGSYSLTASGIADAFILKLTPAGNLAWAYKFGGSLMDGGTSIALNHNATEIYFTGFYRDTIDLDPGPAIAGLSTSANPNAFLCKFSQATNGLSEYNSDNTISVFPNPAGAVLTVKIDAATLLSNTKLSICDPLGNVLLEELMSNNALQLNIEHLSKGIYFLTVSEGGSVISSKKLIKQ